MSEGHLDLHPVPRYRVHRHVWTALVITALLPVTLLFLAPVMLGIQRYVIATDDMGDAVPRGSVALERSVPLGDVVVGDIVTFTRPGGTGLVTRRVVGLADGGLVTSTAAAETADPWVVAPASGAVSRLVVHVPWVGLPFLEARDRRWWAMVLVLPLLGVAGGLTWGNARERRSATPTPV